MLLSSTSLNIVLIKELDMYVRGNNVWNKKNCIKAICNITTFLFRNILEHQMVLDQLGVFSYFCGQVSKEVVFFIVVM